jgi:hypothetical protein
MNEHALSVKLDLLGRGRQDAAACLQTLTVFQSPDTVRTCEHRRPVPQLCAACRQTRDERVTAASALTGLLTGGANSGPGLDAYPRAADVVIAVHELAANAVRHGAGGGLLTMRVQAGRLRCRVSDTGPERIDGNALRTVTTGQPWPVLSGHGLWLVRETADEVTMASGPDGYSVTALFRLSG